MNYTTVMGASDDFWSAFNDGTGGCLRECACGRTFFHDTDRYWDWGPGELEDLRRRAGLADSNVVAINETAEGTTIGVIRDCPCELAARYEHFLHKHRREILRYYRRVLDRELKTAVADSDALKSIDSDAAR